MSSSLKPSVAGAALLVGLAIAGCTQTPPAVQIAALPASDAAPASYAVTLPGVAVVAPQPYAPGNGPRPGPGNHDRPYHFRVWPGYDSDPAMHPYTSNLGPCTEGANGSGCELQHGQLIKPSHYERPPFTD